MEPRGCPCDNATMPLAIALQDLLDAHLRQAAGRTALQPVIGGRFAQQACFLSSTYRRRCDESDELHQPAAPVEHHPDVPASWDARLTPGVCKADNLHDQLLQIICKSVPHRSEKEEEFYQVGLFVPVSCVQQCLVSLFSCKRPMPSSDLLEAGQVVGLLFCHNTSSRSGGRCRWMCGARRVWRSRWTSTCRGSSWRGTTSTSARTSARRRVAVWRRTRGSGGPHQFIDAVEHDVRVAVQDGGGLLGQ